MAAFKVGDIIKVKVNGIQHYGIFVKPLDDDRFTGLIHISEISSDFVKNVGDFAKVDDILYAKILDVDETNFKIKLSIKATNKVRSKGSNFIKYKKDPRFSDFSGLSSQLNGWIKSELKEIKEND